MDEEMATMKHIPWLDPEEMIARFNQGKSAKQMVEVFADECSCKKSEVVEHLKELGVDGRKLAQVDGSNAKKAVNKVASDAAKTTKAIEKEYEAKMESMREGFTSILNEKEHELTAKDAEITRLRDEVEKLNATCRESIERIDSLIAENGNLLADNTKEYNQSAEYLLKIKRLEDVIVKLSGKLVGVTV